MDSVTLSAVIGEDRRLIIDLPPDTPTGEVELTIRASQKSIDKLSNPATETARAKFIAVGALSTAHQAPVGFVPLTLIDRMSIGKLPAHARPSKELIDEDRGEF